jgi:hypothetical protein
MKRVQCLTPTPLMGKAGVGVPWVIPKVGTSVAEAEASRPESIGACAEDIKTSKYK